MDLHELKARTEKMRDAFAEIEATDGVVETALPAYEGRAMAKLLAAASHLGSVEEAHFESLADDPGAQDFVRELRADLMELLEAAEDDYSDVVDLEDYVFVELLLDWSDPVVGENWREHSTRYGEAVVKLARVVDELEAMDLEARYERLIPFFEYMEFTLLMQDLRNLRGRFIEQNLRRLRELLEEMHEHPDWADEDATEMTIHIDDRLEEMGAAGS
jgi:hypothetical protein